MQVARSQRRFFQSHERVTRRAIPRSRSARGSASLMSKNPKDSSPTNMTRTSTRMAAPTPTRRSRQLTRRAKVHQTSTPSRPRSGANPRLMK
jgi:hypothetical protein